MPNLLGDRVKRDDLREALSLPIPKGDGRHWTEEPLGDALDGLDIAQEMAGMLEPVLRGWHVGSDHGGRLSDCQVPLCRKACAASAEWDKWKGGDAA